MSKFFALYVTPSGNRFWQGPFDTNTEAREAVPVTSVSSIIVEPIVMTPGERAEAGIILGPFVPGSAHMPRKWGGSGDREGAVVFLLRWYCYLARAWVRYVVLRKSKTSKRGSRG